MTAAQQLAIGSVLVLQGVNHPRTLEQLKEWWFSILPDDRLSATLVRTPHFTIKPTDPGGLGQSMVNAIGFTFGLTPQEWITPWDLEAIGNRATTAPYTRTAGEQLDWNAIHQ